MTLLLWHVRESCKGQDKTEFNWISGYTRHQNVNWVLGLACWWAQWWWSCGMWRRTDWHMSTTANLALNSQYGLSTLLKTVQVSKCDGNILTGWGLNLTRITKTQSVPRSKHSVSLIKTSQLMLYREIIAVCSQIHTKHINTLCGQNVKLLKVKLVVHIVTTGL
jgi:hypothetical protein